MLPVQLYVEGGNLGTLNSVLDRAGPALPKVDGHGWPACAHSLRRGGRAR